MIYVYGTYFLMQSGEPRHVHVLSIRDDDSDEKLIEAIWGADQEIYLQHVACGAEALARLQERGRKLPNLILLAWRFEDNQLSATETLDAFKADSLLRTVPVVVLAGHLSPESIEELYAAGVACVFEMPFGRDELAAILRSIKDLWLNTARLPYSRQQVYLNPPYVTDREKAVIRLIAKDLSGKEIAHKLGISPKTVEFHVQNIKMRIGAKGKSGIIRFALNAGILRGDEHR